MLKLKDDLGRQRPRQGLKGPKGPGSAINAHIHTHTETLTHTHAHSTQAGPKTKSTSSWRGEAWSGIWGSNSCCCLVVIAYQKESPRRRRGGGKEKKLASFIIILYLFFVLFQIHKHKKVFLFLCAGRSRARSTWDQFSLCLSSTFSLTLSLCWFTAQINLSFEFDHCVCVCVCVCMGVCESVCRILALFAFGSCFVFLIVKSLFYFTFVLPFCLIFRQREWERETARGREIERARALKTGRQLHCLSGEAAGKTNARLGEWEAKEATEREEKQKEIE